MGSGTGSVQGIICGTSTSLDLVSSCLSLSGRDFGLKRRPLVSSRVFIFSFSLVWWISFSVERLGRVVIGSVCRFIQ